jgi:signal transduction histidine kinase
MNSYPTVNNLQQFERNISKAITSFLLIIFFITSILFMVIHNQNKSQENIIKTKTIDLAFNTLKNNLSEKLSIISNSTIFVNFLSSGNVTRKELEPRFLTELLPLRSNGVIGYTLLNFENGTQYQAGKNSEYFVTLKLCYLANKLDSENGNCYGLLKLFFSLEKVLDNITHVNSDIHSCKDCNTYSFSMGNTLGTFPIQNQKFFGANITVESQHEHIIYYYLMITFIFLGFSMFYKIKIRAIIIKMISKPLDKLVKSIELGAKIFTNTEALGEINYLSAQIQADRNKLSKINEYKKNAALGLLAAGVAHDIRSPLASMEMSLCLISKEVAQERLLILKMAIQSVRDIANNLLDKYRSNQVYTDSKNISFNSNHDNLNIIRPTLLGSLLEQIISQKRLEWLNRTYHLVSDFDPALKSIWISVAPSDFKRVVSNLLNNAIEACQDSASIHISIRHLINVIELKIIDNGTGIPKGKLDRLFQGESSKPGGNGLGLSGARKYIKSIGGNIAIDSETHNGTVITINFPSMPNPTWFPEKILLSPDDFVIILDDDVSMHTLWLHRLKNHPVKVHIFTTYLEADNWMQLHKFIIDQLILLVDYELSDKSKNGIDFLKSFNKKSRCFLVTSHAEELHIQKDIENLGSWLIPKALVNDVPIVTINY